MDTEYMTIDAMERDPRFAANRENVGNWKAPTPVVVKLPAVIPFNSKMLPRRIGDYVMDVADRQQSAPDFAGVTALCGLASIIGSRVRIAPKQHDDWEVVPNLWGAIIGRPSAMKSPAMRSALAPLYAIQDEMRETWQEEADSAEIDAKLSSFEAKNAAKQAEKAMKGGDKDAARALLTDNRQPDHDSPPCPRLIVNDASVEKLGELLNENPRGLLLVRDELPGLLARLESHDGQSERAFFLEAFNGDGKFTYDRIGRGTIAIRNCTLSLIGGVQPSRIAPLVRGALSGATNDGLIQRLQLAVWPDDLNEWRFVDRSPDPDAKTAYADTFEKLRSDDTVGSPENPKVFRFSPTAQEMFNEWLEELHAKARKGNLSPTLESHILKLPKTVASLALIFELIIDGRFEVTDAALKMALAWADYLESHAVRLYASGDTGAEEAARLIEDRRDQLDEEFSARDVHRKGWTGLTDIDAVDRALATLGRHHRCREFQKPSGAGGGRPTSTYRWNPRLGV